MTLKKQVYRADKRTNTFVALVLFLISIVLLIITGTLGFIYGLFHSLFTKGIKGFGAYLIKIAVSIDQLGNVLMQHLLNVLWVKKGGYMFGNRDETISSALGRNKKIGTLTGFGKAIDRVLNSIDRNHTLNSIDHFIEPSEQIIDTLAWIHIVDGKLLSTRSKGRSKYTIPSGKPETNEADTQTLFREIKEKLHVELQLSSLNFIGVFEAQADSHELGILVHMTCYSANYKGNLRSDSEVWLNYKDRHLVSEVDKLIFDFLKDKGVLV